MKKAFRILVLIFLLISFYYAKGINNAPEPVIGQWDFQLQKIWETDRGGNDQLVKIIDIMADKEGQVFVFDRTYNKFFTFDSRGKFLFSFGKTGEGPGEYKNIFTTHLVDDYLVASGLLNIHLFSKKGIHLKTLKTNSFKLPIIFIDNKRFVCIPDDPYGKREYSQLYIYDMITQKSKTLASIAAEKPVITNLRGGGKFTVKDPRLTPMIMVASHQKSLYLAKSDKYFFKRIDLQGNELLSFSVLNKERKKISDKIKRNIAANMKFHGSRMPEEMIKKLVKNMPSLSPLFHHISIDENGFIYVYLNNITDSKNQEIDIFSPKGRYLYHSELTFSEEQTLVIKPLIQENHLYVFVEDNDGERKLIKYKIKKPSKF